MFGLENGKQDNKKQAEEELLDFELDVSDTAKQEKLKQHVMNRVQQIKSTLRGGAVKEEFDHFGVLLHGYTALAKLIEKAPKK